MDFSGALEPTPSFFILHILVCFCFFQPYVNYLSHLSPRASTRVSTGISIDVDEVGARSVVCLFFLWGLLFHPGVGGSEPPESRVPPLSAAHARRRDKLNISCKCLLFCRGGDHLNTTQTPFVFSSQAIGF